MKLSGCNVSKGVWAALLFSSVLLAGCGQEDDADGSGVPEDAPTQEQSTQDQQDAGVAEDVATQDDQFVSEEESVSADAEMNGESSNTATAPEEAPLNGEANEDPGFGEGTDPMPGDGEDASDLADSSDEGSEDADIADGQDDEASQDEEASQESEDRSE